MVLLESLIEKKNMYIYIDQRTLRLWVSAQEIDEQLRDPTVSPKKKKELMRGQQKLQGRYMELNRLKATLAQGQLKKNSKEMWLRNFKEGLIGETAK